MDKIEELQDRIRQINLVISRVPKDTKTKFIELANAQFCNDYGQTLKFIFDQAIEYQNMKVIFFENMNMKLDYLNSKTETSNSEQKTTKEIRLCSGKVLKKEVE